MTRRQRKEKLYALLNASRFEQELTDLVQNPGQPVITSLLSFISHPDDRIRWRAVIALGAAAAAASDRDLEWGRRIIRRLMWSLNDESGSIGWGAPEAMAEIMAGNEELAREYGPILISYISEEVNFLEEIRLQQGVLWGLGRLAQVYPELVADSIPFVRPYLKSCGINQCRAMAAWVLGIMGVGDAGAELESLLGDGQEVTFWRDGALVRMTIDEIAKDALTMIAQ